MPMHDWTRVDAGIYHHFHHEWITAIHRDLLARLPENYYSLAEQIASGFGPDVLTLKLPAQAEPSGGGVTTLARPKTKLFQEIPSDSFEKRKKSVVIRHVSGDQIVAVVEIVSPGNKNSIHGVRAFVKKARELLSKQIHLLVIDPLPINSRNPQGLHALIVEDLEPDPLKVSEGAPLAMISYECDEAIRTYLEPLAVGDEIPTMPLYLSPGFYLALALESTYMSAWEGVPKRWQDVIVAE